MGIFDFFKKLKKEEVIEEIPRLKLPFSGIGNWIGGEVKGNESKEREILELVREKISILSTNLEGKIKILEAFDVEAKKAEDKMKYIVTESREKYVGSVGGLLENLNHMNEIKLEATINRINKLFFDFNKNTSKNYERATILIGKEMATVRDVLKNFSRELIKIFEGNKIIIDNFKKIDSINLKLGSVSPIDETLGRISSSIASINNKVSEKQKEKERLEEEIDKIRNSQEHNDFLNKQKEIVSIKEITKKDMFELKQLIDFKSLANFFHINENQMSLLKAHKEDFQTHFEKDNGMSILGLLEESKLNTSSIFNKINNIRDSLGRISLHENSLGVDKTQEVQPKMKTVDLDIEGLRIERAKEEKRLEKFEEDRIKLLGFLKEELEKMNVQLIGT